MYELRSDGIHPGPKDEEMVCGVELDGAPT